MQLCVVGEEPKAVEKLRAVAEHQLAVCPSCLLGPLAQKTLSTFSEPTSGVERQIGWEDVLMDIWRRSIDG